MINYKEILLTRLPDIVLLNEYISIIENIQKECRVKRPFGDVNYVYYEQHHILPKILFPEYEHCEDNLINRYRTF